MVFSIILYHSARVFTCAMHCHAFVVTCELRWRVLRQQKLQGLPVHNEELQLQSAALRESLRVLSARSCHLLDTSGHIWTRPESSTPKSGRFSL